MKLHVEIFFTKIEKENILYFRDQLDLSYKSKDPDIYVHRVVEEYAYKLEATMDNSIIHSTSWRCEHTDFIVLTYIVYSDALNLKSKHPKKIPIKELKLVGSHDVNKPKPVDIAEKNIVSHGLRHISYLVENDPIFEKRIRPAVKDAFAKIDKQLAGKIS